MNEAFFAEAGRGLLIEQLVHHGSFTDDVILLSGPQGVGKSACAQALVHSLSHDIALSIDLKAPADFAFIEHSLSQSPDGRLLKECLSGENSSDSCRLWLVVDDAQLLTPDALTQLSQQFAGFDQGTLVLCIDDAALPGVTSTLGDFESQLFVLKPLSSRQMQAYVDFWFAAAGSEGALSTQEIDGVISQSQGLPGLAAGPLTQLLLKQATAASGSQLTNLQEEPIVAPTPPSYQTVQKAAESELREAHVPDPEPDLLEDELKADEVVLSTQVNETKSPQKSKTKRSRKDKNRKKRTRASAKTSTLTKEASVNLADGSELKQQTSESSSEPVSLARKPLTLIPYLLMFLITCVLGWFMLALFYPQGLQNSASKPSSFSPSQREALLNSAKQEPLLTPSEFESAGEKTSNEG